MNCVGYTPQEHQVRKSHQILNKQLQRDTLLKEGWIQRMDQFNDIEQRQQDHIDRRNLSLMSSHLFHSNRNSMHTFRHQNAVAHREALADHKEQRFNDLAHKKLNQTEAFIERRTRLLVEMAGDERAKREILLRDARAESMAKCNAARKEKLRYCG